MSPSRSERGSGGKNTIGTKFLWRQAIFEPSTIGRQNHINAVDGKKFSQELFSMIEKKKPIPEKDLRSQMHIISSIGFVVSNFLLRVSVHMG